MNQKEADQIASLIVGGTIFILLWLLICGGALFVLNQSESLCK